MPDDPDVACCLPETRFPDAADPIGTAPANGALEEAGMQPELPEPRPGVRTPEAKSRRRQPRQRMPGTFAGGVRMPGRGRSGRDTRAFIETMKKPGIAGPFDTRASGSPHRQQLDQERRSIISFLISAIANAGFRPFGQVRAQFMMVWQRYSLNGSSRSSRRAPVSSSRESMIQR